MFFSKARAAAHLFVSGTLLATASLTLVAAPADATPPGTDPTPHSPVPKSAPPAPEGALAKRFDAKPLDRVPGELLVRYAPGASSALKASARDRVDATLLERLPVRGLELLKVRGVDAAEAALEKRPGVLYAEPNYVYRASSTPDDPRFGRQWGLHNTGQTVNNTAGTPGADIDAPAAWDVLTGSPDVTVAVVDSGVAYRHPDLTGNIWSNPGEIVDGVDDDGNGYVDDVRGWDWIGGDNDPDDVNGHGTHVAGTIAAQGNNGLGVTGVTWRAKIMPLRILDANGEGTAADMVEAVAYADAMGADVLNASLGGPEQSQALAEAIANASDMLVVVAAGNEGTDDDTTPSYPCSFSAPNLVCVAATDNRDRLAWFSNYGETSVDVAAPGVGILSTRPARTTLFSEGFGSGLGGFVTGGTSAWGTEGTGGHAPFASDSVGSAYAPNADSLLSTASPLDLSDQEGCRLGFLYRLDLEEGYDFLSVEGRTGGDAWSPLGSTTGHSGSAWRTASLPLQGFDGASSVSLRFRLRSDDTVQYDGAQVDNVAVTCAGGPFTGSEYGYDTGTSMATPHVAGAAALLVAAAPDASPTELRQALVDGAEARASLAGKTVSGGRLNVRGALEQLASVVEVASRIATVDENAGEARVQVRRAGRADLPASVDYATSDGTATAGVDYSATSGTLTFAAGQRTATVAVPIEDDRVAERTETVVVSLRDPSGQAALLGLDSTQLRISTSDQQPDALISKAKRRGYVGNDIYNRTGRRQTRLHRARREQSRTFFVRIANDGSVRNRFTVKGSGTGRGARVRYFAGTRDITRAMRSAAGWHVRLAPGRFRLVRARVDILRRAAIDSRKPFTVRATWHGDGPRLDVVKGVVRVVR